MPNAYEVQARLRKAIKLADILSGDFSHKDVMQFNDEHWKMTEAAAKVKPSSEETRREVIQMLKDREARKR
jgi:hypothetical protein